MTAISCSSFRASLKWSVSLIWTPTRRVEPAASGCVLMVRVRYVRRSSACVRMLPFWIRGMKGFSAPGLLPSTTCSLFRGTRGRQPAARPTTTALQPGVKDSLPPVLPQRIHSACNEVEKLLLL